MEKADAAGTKARMRVYVAGPYTHGDVDQNVMAAMDAADALIEAGYAPYVPHLSHFMHMAHPRAYEDWIALDMVWLGMCEALVRLPGRSAGADAEEAWARAHGMAVYQGVEDLIQPEGR